MLTTNTKKKRDPYALHPRKHPDKKYIYKLIVLRTMKVRKHKPKSMYITARAYKA